MPVNWTMVGDSKSGVGLMIGVTVQQHASIMVEMPSLRSVPCSWFFNMKDEYSSLALAYLIRWILFGTVARILDCSAYRAHHIRHRLSAFSVLEMRMPSDDSPFVGLLKRRIFSVTYSNFR